MKRAIGIFIIVISAVLGYFLFEEALQPENQKQTKKDITFGFVGVLSGDAAFYGEEDKSAVNLAVEEINAQGGVSGQMLKVIYEDGQCEGPAALSAVKKLHEINEVSIILGGTCSSETLAIAPYANEKGLFVLSAYSSSPDVTNAGPSVFRTAYSDTDSAKATANLLVSNGASKVAIVSENTDFATAFSRVFEETLTGTDVEILGHEIYAPDTRDYRSISSKIITLQPDAILVSPQGSGAGTLMKQLRELGFEGDFYGNSVTHGSETLELAGDAADGLYFADVTNVEEDPRAQEFLKKYVERYGEEPPFSLFLSMIRYDSVHTLAQALTEYGEDTQKIKNYFGQGTFKGTVTNYSFDKNGDIEGLQFDWFQVVGGEKRKIN